MKKTFRARRSVRSAHAKEVQHNQHDCDEKNNVYQCAHGLLQNQKPKQPQHEQDAANNQQHDSASR
jgi:hypothetical protein